MRHRKQNLSELELVSLNFNRALLIYLHDYHGNGFKLWILAAHVRIYDVFKTFWRLLWFYCAHTQLHKKLNESFGLISSMTGCTFITTRKNRKKIGHRENISELSVLIHVGKRIRGWQHGGRRSGKSCCWKSPTLFNIAGHKSFFRAVGKSCRGW